MTGNHEQDAEEESSASEGERETVGKPTGKTPDMQNVWEKKKFPFRRRLIAALRPSLQKEVLRRGINVEFSSMQDILEKAKDIEDS